MAILDCGFWTWEEAKILHGIPNRAQDYLCKISAQYLNVYVQAGDLNVFTNFLS